MADDWRGAVSGRHRSFIATTYARHERRDDDYAAAGCVVYPTSELIAPGVVKHVEGDRFPIGELDGSNSMRAANVSVCFIHAGFKAPILADIRAEIWLRLWGNLRFNPISALTGSTLIDICQDPRTRVPGRSRERTAVPVAGSRRILASVIPSVALDEVPVDISEPAKRVSDRWCRG